MSVRYMADISGSSVLTTHEATASNLEDQMVLTLILEGAVGAEQPLPPLVEEMVAVETVPEEAQANIRSKPNRHKSLRYPKLRYR